MSNITTLPITHVSPNPLQPRGKFKAEELQELVDSIKAHGILEPLVIAKTPAGMQIIAGERRWRAGKKAGLKEVPVIIRETTPQGMLEMALIENVQREDLNPLERAKALDRLRQNFDLSDEAISQQIGKSQSYVKNSLRLLQLPDVVKNALLNEDITEGHGRALLGIPLQKDMVEVFKLLIKENASVRRTEELVRRYKRAERRTDDKSAKNLEDLTLNSSLDESKAKLEKYFGKKSKFKIHQSGRQAKFIITLKGTPYQTKETVENIVKALENTEKTKLME